jgi:hypothetical protein
MGEEHVGVNLVAEDESEVGEDEDQDQDEDEEWWVRTVGMMEMPDRGEEILSEVDEPEPDEPEPEHPPDDCFPDGIAEDGWWSPGSTQPYSAGGGAGVQHPSARWLPHNESTAATGGPLWGNCLASRAPSGGG